MLTQILNSKNMRLLGLPFLDSHMFNNKNMLCYNWCLVYFPYANFKFHHVNG